MNDERKIISCFRYKAEFKYTNTLNGKVKEIPNACIKAFVIDHNYDVNNMPILYIMASLDKALVDDMILNASTNLINMVLYKYNDCTDDKLDIECFRKRFTYFIPNDINKFNSIDYNEKNEDTAKDNTFMDITFGMMDVDIINTNKASYNMTINNTLKYDYVKYCTSNIKNILIEPFDYNELFKQFVIPPLDSLSKTIKYINDYKAYYSTPYRFYMDFNYSYLISSSGKEVLKKNEQYGSILFNINDTIDDTLLDPGMSLNKTTNNYEVQLSQYNTIVHNTHDFNKSFNQIKSITSTGAIKTSLNNSNLYDNEKTKSIRINNNNTNIINNIIADSNSTVFISLNKTDLDTDLFSINKRYTINNVDAYKKYNGRYILLRKRETYIREDETFRMSMMLNFKNV